MSFLHDLSTLGSNPNVRVLKMLRAGSLGFSDLLGDSVATESALSEHLRELDRAGLVVRRVEPGPPLRVLYELTPAGARLAPTLEALATWLDAGPPSAPASSSALARSSNYA